MFCSVMTVFVFFLQKIEDRASELSDNVDADTDEDISKYYIL